MTKQFKVSPIPRKDLLDLSKSGNNFWTNHTWAYDNEVDKHLLPYVLDIFKGNLD